MRDSWDTTSGLLDEYIQPINEAWFTYDPQYRNGEICVLKFRGPAYVPDEDGNLDIEDEEYVQLYSCGDGWEPTKKGREAENASGKTQFNKQSSIGRVIGALKGLGDEVMTELRSRGQSYEADTWEGLVFRFERKVVARFKDRETNEMVEHEMSVPVEYLGTVDEWEPEGKKGKKAPAKKASTSKSTRARKAKADDDEAPKAKSTSRRRKSKSDESDDNPLRAAVIEFANEFDADEFEEFLNQVYDAEVFEMAPELEADEELSVWVNDEDEGLWADIH